MSNNKKINTENKIIKTEQMSYSTSVFNSETDVIKNTNDNKTLIKNNKSKIINIKEKIKLKFEEGSFITSIFNLCILSLGTGLLNIPQKIGYMSIFFGTLIIILAGLANLFTLLILSKMSDKFKITKYDLLVKYLFGNRASTIFNIILVLNQSGQIILYQVLIYKLLGGIINELYVFKKYENIEEFNNNSLWGNILFRIIINYLLSILILFPLCLKKDIKKMRFISMFGLLSLFFLILIIIFECPFYIKEWNNDKISKLNYIDITKGIDKNYNLLKCFGTLFYAFSCHVGVFPVIESIKNPNIKKINKIFKYSINIDIICYLIIGFAGYFTQPINTPDIIIERKNLINVNRDYIMILGQFCFLLTLIAKVAINYNSFRLSVLGLLDINSELLSNKLNKKITFLFLIFSTLIAIFFTSVSDLASLLGSFFSILISFVIPGLIYIKGNGYPLNNKYNIFTFILVICLSFFGLLTGILTIISMIR